MSARYELHVAEDGTSYQFITDAGNTYLAYFTEFFLQGKDGSEVPTISFGFTCKLTDESVAQPYDVKIRETILYIVREFFSKQPDEAMLYLCLTGDGRARQRHVTFKRWHGNLIEELEKHDAPQAINEAGFYGSILIKPSNPNKKLFIDAFYHTIDLWDNNG